MKQGSSQNIVPKDLEIKSASHLALVEIVFGSMGHGFKIPFTGTFLSYYQLYVCLAMMIRRQALPIQVFNTSVLVALLKTLSPMGKKITPMIAIFTQGFLLWFGTSLGGGHILGMALGSALFVSWSILQIAIGYTLVYGFDFFRMIEFFQNEMNDYTHVNIYSVFIAYWVLKIILAQGLIVFLVFKRSSSSEWSLDEKKLLDWRAKFFQNQRVLHYSDFKRAVKDLTNPFFFLSLALMVVFHFFQNTSNMQIVWFVCRTLAMAFLMFYLIRADWVKRFLFSWFGKNKRYRTLYKKMYLVKRRLEEHEKVR